MYKRLLFVMLILAAIAAFFACSKEDCEDDPDCINTPGGWQEINVDDGNCSCA